MTKVLLLEDDDLYAEVIEEFLALAGYEVTLTTSFKEAHAACETDQFDVVVSDLFIVEQGSLSHRGGYSLIQKLREPEREGHPAWWRTVPVLAITGGIGTDYNAELSNERVLDRARLVGADAMLQKPFSQAALVDAVASLLEPNNA